MVLFVSLLSVFAYVYLHNHLSSPPPVSALLCVPWLTRPPLTRLHIHEKLSLATELLGIRELVPLSFSLVSPFQGKPCHDIMADITDQMSVKFYLKHICIIYITIISSFSSFSPYHLSFHFPMHCCPCHCYIYCLPGEGVDRYATSDAYDFARWFHQWQGCDPPLAPWKLLKSIVKQESRFENWVLSVWEVQSTF